MTNENTNVSFTEVRTAELNEQIEKAEAKVAKLKQQLSDLLAGAENESRIEALAEGDTVSYGYGRAATRKLRNGIIRAIAKNEKGLVQLKVETGEGFESEFNIIDATSLLFTPDQVAAEQARIDAAVAEAAAAAEAKAAAEAAAEADKKPEGAK